MLFRLEETLMYKLFNKAFNVGVLFNILLFSALNFLSYLAAYKRHLEYGDMMIGISGGGGFPAWGFPLAWGQGTYSNVAWFADEVLNFIVLTFFSFVFGFLFRFIWSKFSSRRVELK